MILSTKGLDCRLYQYLMIYRKNKQDAESLHAEGGHVQYPVIPIQTLSEEPSGKFHLAPPLQYPPCVLPPPDGYSTD